jgi:hypothetical protein
MRILLVAALLLAPALAAADAKSPPPPANRTADPAKMKTDDCARARKQNKTCVIDMGKAEDITGSAPTAGGSTVGLVRFGAAASLIRIRRDFITEILRAAEDL